MTRTTVFTLPRVNSLRNKSEGDTDLVEKLPDGWSISPVDPVTILAPFRSLHLRPGYVLRAYQFKAGGNGNAIVWAMPVEEHFPQPGDCSRLTNHFLEPPKPSAAVDDFMNVIEGDGSAWSYLSASLLGRELTEFGARWHGCEWSTHTILGADPWKSRKVRSPAETWKWTAPKPAEWKPHVNVTPVGTIRVTFITYTGLGQERIVGHTDTFTANSYRFKRKEKVMAWGEGGYVF